jgi:hypothetical protein
MHGQANRQREVFMLPVAPVLALGLAMAIGTHTANADAALDSPKRHVRCSDASVRQLLRTGFHRSATFASLLSRLEYSDVIVYVEVMPRLPDALEGRLMMLPRAHDSRYVRIQVALRGSPSDSIALLGHELQHALEVAGAPEVNDQTALAAMYKRIGIDYGHNMFETVAAKETGKRVFRELA